MKHITIEKVILFLAAAFAAYNFGLVGGYVEGTKFSAGGVVAGLVVNISLAIAASRFGSISGKNRTRQATIAFMAMLFISPFIVAPVVYYALPQDFLGGWVGRSAWSLAYPLIADLAIVLSGAVSGKGLIALSEPTAAQSGAGAEAGATSAPAVRKGARRSARAGAPSADAVRDECAALSAQYACTEADCGWSPSVDALMAAHGAGKSARGAAASAKAGHAKNRHPKDKTLADALFGEAIKKDGQA